MSVDLLDAALILAADQLEHGDAAAKARGESLRRNAGPLDLAIELNPRLVRTPATELVSRELEWAITTPRARLLLSMPPQETKTSNCRMAVVRKLQHDPDKRNAIASYAVDLARQSGRFDRNIIESFGSNVTDPATGQPLPDYLGLQVRQDHAAAGDWSLAGHDGALYAIGVGGGLTGRPVDGVLVIDDPVKDREQADSPVFREKVAQWRSAVAETRLGPEASVIVVMTRWHQDDLAGRLIAEDLELPEHEREWRVINIPALADGQTLDSLAGVPGARTEDGWLVSARGRTPEQWQRIRRRVGERTWASLYQGRPAPLEGGIFKQAWFEAHRHTDPAPPPMEVVAVIVDPADTGQGDAAGILVMGRTRDARIAVLADVSGQFSQARWGRNACLGWVRWGAARIVQERNLGMRTTIPDAWSIIFRQATALSAAPVGDEDERVAVALRALAAAGDVAAGDETGLREVLPLVADVLDRGVSGPRVVSVTPKQSKRVRAETVAAAYETGRAFLVGRHPELEYEAVTWQEGQSSPNRLDTLAMGTSHLEQASGPAQLSSPAGAARVPSRSGAAPRRRAF